MIVGMALVCVCVKFGLRLMEADVASVDTLNVSLLSSSASLERCERC